MTVSKLTLTRLQVFSVLVLLTVLFGMIEVATDDQPSDIGPAATLLRAVIGWAMGGVLVWGLEIFWLPSPSGAWLRRQHFLAVIAIKSVYTAVAVVFVTWLMGVVFQDRYSLSFVYDPWFARILVIAFVAVVFLQTVLQIVRIVGPRNLVNFVLGRYMRPVREDTVFMFLDLADSTPLSAKFGDIGVQRMITDFFFDITEPIIEHEGTVHRYVGDQVVVTWPLGDRTKNARCIECAFAIKDFVERRAIAYEAAFGTVPTFRIGLHGGPVVISQIGDQKQELSYFGDTVNTAARIEAQCKAIDEWLLISGEMLSRIELPEGLMTRLAATVRLKGREGETDLHAVERVT